MLEGWACLRVSQHGAATEVGMQWHPYIQGGGGVSRPDVRTVCGLMEAANRQAVLFICITLSIHPFTFPFSAFEMLYYLAIPIKMLNFVSNFLHLYAVQETCVSKQCPLIQIVLLWQKRYLTVLLNHLGLKLTTKTSGICFCLQNTVFFSFGLDLAS